MSISDLVLWNSSIVERVDQLRQLAQTAQQLSIAAQGTEEAVIVNAIAATLQRSVAPRHCWPWCNPQWDEGKPSSLVRSTLLEPERSYLAFAFCRVLFLPSYLNKLMMYFDPAHIEQLRQLHQQLAAQNDVMQSMLKLSESMLDTLLAEDARSLLLTPEFAQFIRLMLAEMAADSNELPIPVHISADPCAWLLPSLPLPLRLWRSPQADTPNMIQVQVELGEWQQVFNLPSETLVGSKREIQSWEAIADQVGQTMSQLPIAPALQPFLAEELMCIFCYLGECEYLEDYRSVVEQ